MKHRLAIAPIFVAALLSSLATQAQPEPIKFGKPDPKELTSAAFVGDSAAAAVVLCDYGKSGFEIKDNAFQLVTERITRIKILKKSGYDAATVQVPLYHQDENQEKLTALRGFTYNMVNGQVVKTKLETSKTFTEERTANVRVRKFTMPDVREGSVIEYSYMVKSDFLFNMQDWTFQRDIPTRWSEFRAAIPEYFTYDKLVQGYHALTVNEKIEGSGQYALRTAGTTFDATKGTEHSAATTETLVARVDNYRWALKDVPAMREEPFMTTADDYLDRINFQLAGEKLPGHAYRAVADSWDKINYELLHDDNFGMQLERGNFLKSEMQALTTKYPDQETRAAAVREVVMSSVRYDGTNAFATTGSLRKAYDAHRGTSADVNLLLIAALRDAGLPAHPLLLSTRRHGRVNEHEAMLEKFNYVVALLPLAPGKDLLVDATDPLLPCGVLPQRCLNQQGKLVMTKPADSRWVDLTPAQHHMHYQQATLTLDAQGGLTGKIHEEHAGYAGADARSELAEQGEKKYLAALATEHSGWTISKPTLTNRDNLAKPLAVDYELSQSSESAAAGTLYLSPLRGLVTEQNPFRHDDRTFPVDFGMAQDETLMVTLTLPAGYELAELPKPAIVDLPDSGGRYLYSVAAAAPGIVQLTSRLNLRKAVYGAEEYQHLREFYRLMLAKQAEQLVIKKKA